MFSGEGNGEPCLEARAMRKCLLFCLAVPAFLSVAEIVAGQESQRPVITWTHRDHKRVVVPFESANNLILLRVSVNGSEPLWFNLDSGAGYCFIDLSRAKALGLQFAGTVQAQGAGAGTAAVEVIKGAVDFGFGDVKVSVAPAGAMDLTSIEPVVGHAVDGTLGYDIFQELAITVDYVNHQVTFTDPEEFHPARHGQSLPLSLETGGTTPEDRVPLVHGRIAIPGNPPVDARFLVDSGSGDAIDHPLIRKSTGKLVNTATGVGVGTEMRGVEGRIESLQLGPFELRGAVSACCGGSELSSQLIGGEALSRFTVTFDYPHKRLVLEPNRNYRRPFPADQSGMNLRWDAATREPVVHGLAENSPATEAGMQTGDVIVAIGGVPSLQLSLDRVKQLFEANQGEVDLKVRRGAQTLAMRLRLDHLM
jgi:predicted aspartyl protease